MGIKGLENYIRTNPMENIAENINIRDVITEWQREKGTNPTIIINLMHFVKILAKIEYRNSLVLGGQYNDYIKKIMKFFDKLTQEWRVKLVFFCRPYLNKIDAEIIWTAYDHAVRNSLESFKQDQIKLTGNTFLFHSDVRFLYNLMQICSKYGEIHTHKHGMVFNIVRYAREHSNEVLAMIQNDTNFLLFEGQYQYWNLADLDISRFTTKRYNRNILYERLQLNTKQCQMLAALSQIKDDFIFNFVRTINIEEKNSRTMFKLAAYVRNLENLGNLNQIASDIFGENYTAEQLKEIQKKLSEYEMTEPDNLNSHNQNVRNFVEFCKKNLYFAYNLATDVMSTNQALAYIDLRQPDATKFIYLMTGMLMKQCGIALKDVEQRPDTRTVGIKRTLIDPEFNVEHDEVIIYPPMTLPTLTQLIVQEKDTSFDNSRWSLFQWTLGLDNDFIVKIRTTFESKFMRIVSYTLKFLLLNKSITFREADIIFLTEWDVQNPISLPNKHNIAINRSIEPLFLPNRSVPLFLPGNWRDPNNHILPVASMQPVELNTYYERRPPLVISNWRDRNDHRECAPHNWWNYNNRVRNTIPNRRDHFYIERTWIQIAHKYTIAFESICHCLELCGLRNETDLIQFDVFNFHGKMRREKRGDANIDIALANIRHSRLYCL